MDQSSLNIFLIALVVGMVPQESLEEGYKADYPTCDGGMMPASILIFAYPMPTWHCQALHDLLLTYY